MGQGNQQVHLGLALEYGVGIECREDGAPATESDLPRHLPAGPHARVRGSQHGHELIRRLSQAGIRLPWRVVVDDGAVADHGLLRFLKRGQWAIVTPGEFRLVKGFQLSGWEMLKSRPRYSCIRPEGRLFGIDGVAAGALGCAAACCGFFLGAGNFATIPFIRGS